MERLLSTRPLSDHWQRLLLARLDAVAVIYRLASAVGRPYQFRWYRSAALDAGMMLPDRKTLGVIRQGATTDRTAFSDRVRWLASRLDRIYTLVETTEVEMSDATDRIKEHRERKEKLEAAAEDARATLRQRRVTLDKMETITAFAQDMSEYLKTSELTESRAFIRSFVKEIEVRPGKATIHYSIPTPEDNHIEGGDVAEVVLNGGVMNMGVVGGDRGTRTPNLGIANAALSQLSYIPTRPPAQLYQTAPAHRQFEAPADSDQPLCRTTSPCVDCRPKAAYGILPWAEGPAKPAKQDSERHTVCNRRYWHRPPISRRRR